MQSNSMTVEFLPCIFWRGKRKPFSLGELGEKPRFDEKRAQPTQLTEGKISPEPETGGAESPKSKSAGASNKKLLGWIFQTKVSTRNGSFHKSLFGCDVIVYGTVFLFNKNEGEGRCVVFFQQVQVDLNVNVTLYTVYIRSDIIHPVTYLRSSRSIMNLRKPSQQ